jgi:N,N'-diacetylchitobiose transport system permease protein
VPFGFLKRRKPADEADSSGAGTPSGGGGEAAGGAATGSAGIARSGGVSATAGAVDTSTVNAGTVRGVPFIAITVYAGLIQVPRELVEAARLDGAAGRQVFTHITLPLIRPILAVVTSLSVIWDFQAFNQIWILRNSAPEPDYQTLTIYAYLRDYTGHEYGYASAVAVVTILLLVAVMIVYLRQIARYGEVS